MRNFGGGILLSASDLMRFMGCAHATTLDLLKLQGKGPKPRADSEDAALLQKQGNAHEAAHLEKLKVENPRVVEIESGDLAANAIRTREVLTDGPDVVFQGAFLSGNWGGWSDFLERVDTPSALGNFSYEVTDTKLKRKPHPSHVLQLVLYSDLLAEMQGLRDALPSGIRVGTVDKFQGQEAPVCLVSMTASSAEETSRGMEFLFSLNRINVAVSRAKGLALVFGAPRLREAKCNTVEQMRLVNTLCALPTSNNIGYLWESAGQ